MPPMQVPMRNRQNTPDRPGNTGGSALETVFDSSRVDPGFLWPAFFAILGWRLKARASRDQSQPDGTAHHEDTRRIKLEHVLNEAIAGVDWPGDVAPRSQDEITAMTITPPQDPMLWPPQASDDGDVVAAAIRLRDSCQRLQVEINMRTAADPAELGDAPLEENILCQAGTVRAAALALIREITTQQSGHTPR